MELVRRNCGGSTWDSVPDASIGISRGGMLLVNQSPAVHAEIARLLDQLRLYK